MDRWEGRVAIVTGASSGIGAAVCREFVKSGMKVVGAARRVEKIQALAQELKSEKGTLLGVKCDLTKDEDIINLFQVAKEKFGGVDVCVNNAGLSIENSLLGGTPEEWRHMLEVNVIAACHCTKLAVKSMRERGVDDGHIININSTSGHRIIGESHFRFYGGTKYALTAITEGLRQELREAKSHIRASQISPGFVETEFIYTMLEDQEEAKKVYSSIKCLQSEDLASIVLHVLSAPPHVEINDIILRPTEMKD